MKLEKYKAHIRYPLRQRTVTFLIKGNKVLLGYKKRGFGKGNYLGIGGKVEDETPEQAAKRELQEEINTDVLDHKRKGILNFYFPHIRDESWNQQVIVYVANSWNGKPQETEEIRPQWFDIAKVPFDSMWDDAKYWLPEILDGKTIRREFIFDDKLKVVEQHIIKD